jgi:hypothetical protein
MLRNIPSLIRGVPKPIRRTLGAFTTLHNFIIDLEINERSAFAVFAYSNHHAYAPDSTPTALTHFPQPKECCVSETAQFNLVPRCECCSTVSGTVTTHFVRA